MSAIVFDGKGFVAAKEPSLHEQIKRLGEPPRMGSLVFVEDPGSMQYIGLKRVAAVRMGVEFSVYESSIKETMHMLHEKIHTMNEREDIDGVLVQKPSRRVWEQYHGGVSVGRFDNWWAELVSQLQSNMDVDCLRREHLDRVYAGDLKLVPATVKAIISILTYAGEDLHLFEGEVPGFDLFGMKVAILGRSELVGKPLASVLRQYGADVSLMGNDMDLPAVADAEVVISATGEAGVVTGEMIKEGAIVIDVGAPDPDVAFETVKDKARFVTPVPGGVGPVTVFSLLENLVELIRMQRSGEMSNLRYISES